MMRQIVGREKELEFYRQQSNISSPGRYNSLFENLPTDISELCQLTQNLFVHQVWILYEEFYGITPESLKSTGRNLNNEINLRSIEKIIAFLIELDNQPLTATRDVDKRVVGNCRDYATMLVSILRYQGVPARVRSGVARYFSNKGFLEDHFICEFWNETTDRWQRADAQIDQVQRSALKITMDMTNLPQNQFLDAGESYDELKSGKVTPENIGVMEFRGWKYVLYKLVSDLASINRVEVLAWESWGICERINNDTLSEEDSNLLQEIARLLTELRAHPDRFGKANEFFRTNPDLKMPANYEPYYQEMPFFK